MCRQLRSKVPKANSEPRSNLTDGGLQKTFVGSRITVESVLVFGFVKSLPDAPWRHEKADHHRGRVQEVCNERIASRPKFPRPDFCLSHPVGSKAGEHVMQIVEWHNTFAPFCVGELKRQTQDSNCEGRSRVVLHLETIRNKEEVSSFFQAEAIGVCRTWVPYIHKADQNPRFAMRHYQF